MAHGGKKLGFETSNRLSGLFGFDQRCFGFFCCGNVIANNSRTRIRDKLGAISWVNFLTRCVENRNRGTAVSYRKGWYVFLVGDAAG